VELRLSTMPTVFGEKLVMRIFDPQVTVRSFEELGFDEHELKSWNRMVRSPYGIILVTGPTGSGKTTTLYSTLKQLAKPEVNVCTVEEPIEMVEPRFNQMQVQPSIGLDFAGGLRNLLRQDPDIIMVGEIRDLETAEMAVQAALTGHLVFSTLHTNDAVSAVVRLMDIGVPSYLIRATLLGVVAQRLVRTLCPHCNRQEPWIPSFGDFSFIPGNGPTRQGLFPSRLSRVSRDGLSRQGRPLRNPDHNHHPATHDPAGDGRGQDSRPSRPGGDAPPPNQRGQEDLPGNHDPGRGLPTWSGSSDRRSGSQLVESVSFACRRLQTGPFSGRS